MRVQHAVAVMGFSTGVKCLHKSVGTGLERFQSRTFSTVHRGSLLLTAANMCFARSSACFRFERPREPPCCFSTRLGSLNIWNASLYKGGDTHAYTHACTHVDTHVNTNVYTHVNTNVFLLLLLRGLLSVEEHYTCDASTCAPAGPFVVPML